MSKFFFLFTNVSTFYAIFDTTFVGVNFDKFVDFLFELRCDSFSTSTALYSMDRHPCWASYSQKIFSVAHYLLAFFFSMWFVFWFSSLLLVYSMDMCLHSKFTFVEICLFISSCSSGWGILFIFVHSLSFSAPFLFVWLFRLSLLNGTTEAMRKKGEESKQNEKIEWKSWPNDNTKTSGK